MGRLTQPDLKIEGHPTERGDGRGDRRERGGEGEEDSLRSELSSPEEGDREGRSQRRRLLSRDQVGELVPHLSSGGTLSQGETMKRRGKPTSRASKWLGGLNRGNWTRGTKGQGKYREPLGKACNQTSPDGLWWDTKRSITEYVFQVASPSTS
jgi:hypothetical protein